MYNHEQWLALFTVLVAGIAACIPLNLAIRGWKSGRRTLRYWVAGGVLSIAAGMFALQFIGMLALDLPIRTSYEVPITLLALLIAIIACGFALHTQASELQESERRYRQLVDLSPDAIFIETEGDVAFANSAAAKLLGAVSPEQLVGKPMLELVHMDSRQGAAERMRDLLEQNQWLVPLEEKLLRLDGSSVNVEAIGALHVYGGRRSAQVVMRDITERKKAEERLNYLAQYDSLTGLPNRTLFRDRVEHAMARAKRHDTLAALMLLDLDHFKEINDTLGHTAGDHVLQTIAAVLKTCLRASDTMARLGGDEFTVLVENLKHVDDATAVADKIQQALSAPLVFDGREIFVTASIGISIYPFGGEDIDQLLQAADVAMYRAKDEGRNTYEFYAAEMNADAAERLKIENLLWRALERQEFSVHYQPKVAVDTGRITGIEALLRWTSAEMGLVPPAQFIPLAEKTGLIVPIGEWVLRTACAQNKAWQDHGYSPLLVSVNLSPRQFRQKNITTMVTAALHDSGMAAQFLELEITETMIMVHAEQTIDLLKELHELGVQLSIDDFGTGYSSLAYLKRFPVHKLKVDRSFVTDATTDADDAAIVTAVIALAKSLGLYVTAEGVETKEQLEFLSKLKCDEYQGYYFSEPVPPEQIAGLLESRLAVSAAAS